MARKLKDVFGCDELIKEFEKMEKKYPNQADALLMAAGNTANKRVKQLTSLKTKKKTGKLRNSWRLRPVKLYKNGTVRVVRVQSKAPHAHLIEYGHQIYRGSGRGRTGRRDIKSSTGSKTTAYKLLETAINETRNRFYKDAEKMLDELTKELEV